MKEREIHLVDYLLVLRRRRWVLFSAFLLVVISATIGAYRNPDPTPAFQAVTTLIVRPARPAVLNIKGSQLPALEYLDDSVDQRTQFEILKSRVILEQLANELNLTEQNSSPQKEEQIIEKIRDSIDVVQVTGTYLVKITAHEEAAEKAIKLANTMAEVYIEYNLQTKLTSARKTLGWLNEQIVDLRTKVQNAYNALSDYTNKNQIFSLEMNPELRAAKLSELTNAYETARQNRLETETRFAELRKVQQEDGNVDQDIAFSLNDPIIEKLRGDLVDAKIEIANLLQSYKEQHPKVKQVELTVQAIRQNLTTAINTLLKKIETDLSVLRTKEESLASSLAAFKQEAVALDTKRLEFSKLKSEVSSTEELYNLLFQQLKETSITGDLERNNITVLEPARTAMNITAPLKREQIVAFGVIIGLLLGVGLSFLFEYFDKTIKTPDDVEYYLGLPVLGTIPKIDKNQHKVYGSKSASLSSQKQQYAIEALEGEQS